MEKNYSKLIVRIIKNAIKGLRNGFFLCLAFLAFEAQAKDISIISDEETEQYLASILKPIFSTAGIPFNRNKIFIVNDNTLNAFVGDGNYMFINTGTLLKAKSSDEISGVLAHETGHIEGGHILRQKISSQNMQKVSLASMILAGALGAASGRADVGMAIALGSQSSMLNQYFSYRVEEERSADESAVKLLEANGTSPQGMLDFMKRIQQQNTMEGIEENAYFRTHPMTQERIGFIQNAVDNFSPTVLSKEDEQFKRVQAKLYAYIMPTKQTLQKYKDSTVSAKYARSIAHFKNLQFKQAINEADELIKLEPNNPYFYELKAQMLMETGKVAEAETLYGKALEILPNSELFATDWAQATLENNPSKEQLQKIKNILQKALNKNPNSYGWILLSRTYGELGEKANSYYAAAQYNFRINKPKTGEDLAKEALKHTPSPQLKLKIEDLLNEVAEKDVKGQTQM